MFLVKNCTQHALTPFKFHHSFLKTNLHVPFYANIGWPSRYTKHFSSVVRPSGTRIFHGKRKLERRVTNITYAMAYSSSEFSPRILRLKDYDCVGFDLDNTLCEYNILSTVSMEYNVLANYLIEEKGYDSVLLKPLDESSISFLQKGLILDFSRGNILKISDNGTIYRASHGTKYMTDKEIKESYGSDKQWDVTNEFCKNMLVAWNGPLSEKMRALLDYFDMPASLAFARIVDSLDHKLGRHADLYNIWPDILAGLRHMFAREKFKENGGFFKAVKADPENYVRKCDPVILKWLRAIKEKKITFLITGSNCDFANLTAETCLGKDWKSFFDIIICFARKPGFFTGCRPFVELDGFVETDPVDKTNLKFGEMYSQGNWQELYQLFAAKLGKDKPKCLYIGDNLIQDVYTPSKYTKCDAIAVVEEMTVENDKNFSSHTHPSEAVISSKSWGPYFRIGNEPCNSVWGGIIQTHSRLCVPSLSVLAQHSLNHEFNTFSKGPREGYFPFCPSVYTEKQSIVNSL